MSDARIIYTETDEAPALATYSFLPIVQAFTSAAGVSVETRDISLAGRIIASFPENLTEAQRLAMHWPSWANWPRPLRRTSSNCRTSAPRFRSSPPRSRNCRPGATTSRLSGQPAKAEEEAIKTRYARVLGSAVNPVLREGNSDRRVAAAVKDYARKHPHSMGAWSADSKSHVTAMTSGDFYGSEKSAVIGKASTVKIELVGDDGQTRVLKEKTPVLEGEVIDASVMSVKPLREFFEQAIQAAKDEGVLLSLHLKATMMKVSDPIIFGHAVRVYYKDVFEKYADTFKQLGVNPNNGLGDVYAKIAGLPEDQRQAIEADIQATYQTRPELAMVNSDKGITNLHVPSDVIVDASMPAAIRSSGKMWGPDGKLHDTKAMIPDRSYAGVYQAVIDF